LGGGGTDLASYYSNYGGFVIAGAINRYCTILANKRFYPSIRLSYSQLEVKNRVEDIEHRIFRSALQLTNITGGIELHSTADVPSNSGLGSSSSFTVALLMALHSYKREYVTRRQLAEEACHIEIDMLGEPIGKQDQYIATYGGLNCFTFENDGNVLIEPLRVSPDIMDQLENNLVLFFTGRERAASDILRDQDNRSKADDAAMIENLHKTKDIGLQTRKYLENGKIDMLGELFHEHWENKKKRSSGMSDSVINESYDNSVNFSLVFGVAIVYIRTPIVPMMTVTSTTEIILLFRLRLFQEVKSMFINNFSSSGNVLCLNHATTETMNIKIDREISTEYTVMPHGV